MSGVVQYEASGETGVNLSEAAKNHVLSYLARQANCRGIRFSVKKRVVQVLLTWSIMWKHHKAMMLFSR